MDNTISIVIIINIAILIFAFLVKTIHNYYHQRNINNGIHDKLDVLNDVLNNLILPNINKDNETVKKIDNILNQNENL
jgi:hypothetical protein